MVCDEEEGAAFGDRIDNLKFNKQQLDKVTVDRHNLLVEALLLSQQFSDVHKDMETRLTITEDLLTQVRYFSVNLLFLPLKTGMTFFTRIND